MIRKAKEQDIEAILDVLGSYNFKVLNAVDGAPVDDDASDILYLRNEITELDLKHAFVALHNGKIVGFCHYKHLEEGVAKTTLITVLPQYRELGLGKALQLARMKEAYEGGHKRLMTFCESPAAIRWYMKHFNYKILGTEPLLHRLYFFKLKDTVIWGIHYGFNEEFQKKMVCDLENFFNPMRRGI
jgi:N-acetylglutamate synthase-like GNAT family acetyltransferase